MVLAGVAAGIAILALAPRGVAQGGWGGWDDGMMG